MSIIEYSTDLATCECGRTFHQWALELLARYHPELLRKGAA